MSNISGNNQYTHISANTAGVAIGTAGQSTRLRSININTKGAASNVLTIYDGSSTGGTVVAVFDTTVSFGTFLFDLTLLGGLFVVLATGTPADITIAWTPGN